MTTFFNETKLPATAACALLLSALILDGTALCRHMAAYALSIMTAHNAYTSISILASAFCLAFASRLFDARHRRRMLESRARIAGGLGLVALIVHVCIFALPSPHQHSDQVGLLVEAVVPLALFLPLVMEVCFASMLAWGSIDLRQALCFPLVFLGAVLLTDVYGIDELLVSLACVLAGSALLIGSAHAEIDTFCIRMTPQSSMLGWLSDNRRLVRSSCSLGLSAMAVLLSLSISTLEFCSSAQLAILLILLIVYFYAREPKAKILGILALLVVVLFMWLYGFEHERMYFLLLISSYVALVHVETGPKNLCLVIAVLLGGLGICNAVHCSDQYLGMIIVSYIAAFMLVILVPFLVFCRPEGRIVVAWLVPRKKRVRHRNRGEFDAMQPMA